MGQDTVVDKTQNGGCNDHKSDLAHIDFTGTNPFLLFQDWHKEARGSHLVNPDALCFSTCSRDGRPSSRHLLLRRLDDDGFVIMTDVRSRKSKELTDNPLASIAFLWSYKKDSQTINKQVRIDGRVEELPQSECQEIWEREPLFCKIRANLCDQGCPVDWEEHKSKHDQLYEDVVSGKWVPSLPNHVVFYKVVPSFMEFYYAHDNCIGDRLAFKGDDSAKRWKVERIAA